MKHLIRILASAVLLGLASPHAYAIPVIDLEKLVNGQDADAPPGPLLLIGSIATFTYLVSNAGDENLSNIFLRDDNETAANAADDFTPTFVGGDVNSNGFLDLVETWTFAATRTVTAGQHQNIAFVSGVGAGSGLSTSDSDLANYFGVTRVVAEPATLALFAIGLAGLGLRRRRGTSFK